MILCGDVGCLFWGDGDDEIFTALLPGLTRNTDDQRGNAQFFFAVFSRTHVECGYNTNHEHARIVFELRTANCWLLGRTNGYKSSLKRSNSAGEDFKFK